MSNRRRAGLIILIAAGVVACHKRPDAAPVQRQAVTTNLPIAGLYQGSNTAPVVLVEFGSFACGTCREFSVNVFATFDSLYIRSGKVRYRYVDVSPNGVFSYSSALSECIAGSKDLAMAKRFVFDSVLRTPDLGQSVAMAAALMGVTTVQAKDCVRAVRSSPRRAEEKRAADRLGVVATPTFIVGQIDAKGRLTGWPYIGLEPDSLRHLIDVAATALSRRH